MELNRTNGEEIYQDFGQKKSKLVTVKQKNNNNIREESREMEQKFNEKNGDQRIKERTKSVLL